MTDPYHRPESLPQEETFALRLMQSLGRLEGKIDELIANERKTTVNINDHEVRIRELEKTKWRESGVILAVTAVISYLISTGVKIGVFPQ